MAFLDQDGLSVVLSNLKTKFTALFAAKSHSHAYSELTGKPTIDTALSNTSTNAVQNKVIYTELGKKSNVADIKDNLTSSDTDKPLSAAQGKALKAAIDSITGEIGELGGGDMMKATYDVNGNGVVDNAEKLGGQAPSYYLSLENMTGDTGHRTITDAERTAWNGKSDFSGSYGDLTDKPTIPTNNNQLTNGAGYQTAEQVNNAIKAAASKVIQYGGSTDLSGLADLATADNLYKMYNVTEGFTTTGQFLEGAGKSYPAGTNVVVVPNPQKSGYVFDIYTGSFHVPALTTTEINSAFTAAGY